MKIFCWGLFGLLCVVIIGQVMRDKTPEEKMMNADRQSIKDCEYVLGGVRTRLARAFYFLLSLFIVAYGFCEKIWSETIVKNGFISGVTPY